ncbi:hypothetical protein [Spongiactinospora sp. TRM90649]|uniref:hypothetical protein n=1 Tax=Spongiactinospora sp. TRM90649 TaxID=3031114 RepID=UPI0023F806C2|nr:hypothetical protein [Spongiactinospora sp. TRM90649]MDF5757796.1 hypothetical protein [Spongiactinospora sp. TRM90649]
MSVAGGRFSLALYPRLEAVQAVDAGMSAGQWRAVGQAVRRIHGTPITPELARIAGRERYRPPRRELIPDIEACSSWWPWSWPGRRRA